MTALFKKQQVYVSLTALQEQSFVPRQWPRVQVLDLSHNQLTAAAVKKLEQLTSAGRGAAAS